MRHSVKLIAAVAFLAFATSAWASTCTFWSDSGYRLYFQNGTFWFGTASSDTGTDSSIDINGVVVEQDIAGIFTLAWDASTSTATAGGTGTYTLYENGNSITATITGWDVISQSGATLGLNGNYQLNLVFSSSLANSNSAPELEALLGAIASLTVSGTFGPGTTHDFATLAATTSAIRTGSFSGVLSTDHAPEPGTCGVIVLGVSTLLFWRRKIGQRLP